MFTPHKFPLIRAVLLASALSSAVMVPAAFAETVEVMILNTRGEDGVYRPALRVLRGSSVTMFTTGNAGLTEAILRDTPALRTWLAANVPAGDSAEPLSFVVTEIPSAPPVVKKEEPEPEPEPTIKDCRVERCMKEEFEEYCAPYWRKESFGILTPEQFCRT